MPKTEQSPFKFKRLAHIIGTTNKYTTDEKRKLKERLQTLKTRVEAMEIAPPYAYADYNVMVGMLHRRQLAENISKIKIHY